MAKDQIRVGDDTNHPRYRTHVYKPIQYTNCVSNYSTHHTPGGTLANKYKLAAEHNYDYESMNMMLLAPRAPLIITSGC